MNEIEKKFISKGNLRPGGWVIYPKIVALELIAEYKQENIPILGVDAFLLGKDIFHPDLPDVKISPDAIQPVMEMSADYSSLTNKITDTYSHATTLISGAPDKYYFEIICGSAKQKIVRL